MKSSRSPQTCSAPAAFGVSLAAWLAAIGCTPFASELDEPLDPSGMMTLGLDPGDWSCVSDEAGNPVDLRLSVTEVEAEVVEAEPVGDVPVGEIAEGEVVSTSAEEEE